MRTMEYKDVNCGGYEVMATEEGHFSNKCEYLFLFRKNEYGKYIPVQEMDGKTLITPPSRFSISTEEEWITYGFQVIAGGLRLHLCNPRTHETDVSYLLEPAIYHFVQCTRNQFNILFLKCCHYTARNEIQYNIRIERQHKGHLGNTDESADEVYIDITEPRDGIIRELLFEDIVPHDKEKWSPKKVSITEKTDF